MGPRCPADARRVQERLQQLQAQGYGHVAFGPLLVALLIGLVVPVCSTLVHELGHALVARRAGLVGVSLPRLDRRRFAARHGFGLTRLLSARDPRGWVQLHPDVAPRQGVAIVAAGPGAEALLALTLVAAGVSAAGTIRAVLLFTALDCLCGACACLVRREGGYGDGVQLRHWLARSRRTTLPGAPHPADPHEATSFAPPG
jgi:hypothetical protein